MNKKAKREEKANKPKRPPGRPKKNAADEGEPKPLEAPEHDEPSGASGSKKGEGKPVGKAIPKSAVAKAKPAAKGKCKEQKEMGTKASPKKKRSPKELKGTLKRDKPEGKSEEVPPPPKRSRKEKAVEQNVEIDDAKNREKQRRRDRAKQAQDRLQAEAIPDLKVPQGLADKISFTCRDPCSKTSQGSSTVGVILYSESFYITKAISVQKWPRTLRDLKAWLVMALYSVWF